MAQEASQAVDHAAVCREIRDLQLRIETHDKELKKLKAEYEELQLGAAAAFIKSGVPNLTVDGRRFYMGRKVFVNKKAGVSGDEVVEALRAANLPGFISHGYNSGGLRAHVKELQDQAEPGTPLEDVLPEPLRPLFNVYEERKITSRVAAKAS